MVTVETIGKVRRAYWVQKKKIKAIARELKLARNTVRSIVRSGETAPVYLRKEQPLPKLGLFVEQLDKLLEENAGKSKRERLTTKRVFEKLQQEAGYSAATTQFAGTRSAGAGSMRQQLRRRLCRSRLRQARPINSTGATRS
jgi:hypothetical protein